MPEFIYLCKELPFLKFNFTEPCDDAICKTWGYLIIKKINLTAWWDFLIEYLEKNAFINPIYRK